VELRCFGLVIFCSIGTVIDFVSEDRMNVLYVGVIFHLEIVPEFSRNCNGNFGYNLILPIRCQDGIEL